MKEWNGNMRVITGRARGHKLKAVPGKGTRPTTDRVKEAMFNTCGPYFHGGNVLDLYAGTGALGIEALSRGCTYAVFVDKDAKSMAVIRENLKRTKLSENALCLKMSAEQAIHFLSEKNVSFDLLLLDPPYRLIHMDALLQEIMDKNLLNRGASVIIEHDKIHEYPNQVGSLVLNKKAVYGGTALSFYSMKLGDLKDE